MRNPSVLGRADFLSILSGAERLRLRFGASDEELVLLMLIFEVASYREL